MQIRPLEALLQSLRHMQAGPRVLQSRAPRLEAHFLAQLAGGITLLLPRLRPSAPATTYLGSNDVNAGELSIGRILHASGILFRVLSTSGRMDCTDSAHRIRRQAR